MTDSASGADLTAFETQLAGASAALQAFAKGPSRQAADDVGAAFERAGDRISRALGTAASRGETSFRRMAKTILEELAKLALDQLFGKSTGASALNIFGSRAAGGAVNVGGAYLVGESGPELFVPRQGGDIAAPSGAVSVHFHLNGGAGANAIMRHQGQIAAAIARAVAYGRRNL